MCLIRIMTRLLVTLLTLLLLASCRRVEEISYRVVSTRPHDTECFTQGLEFLGPRLFESSGRYGLSNIREVNPLTGEVIRKRPMARHVFAEGITIFQGELFVLTWKENTAYVFEPDTFRPIRQHNYEGEGWGLTHNGRELILSDGSSTLRFLDPKTFAVTRRLTVTEGSREIDQLNELEHVNGAIYANIFRHDRVARIDALTGKVNGWLDLSGLRKQMPRSQNVEEVLNGIAHDPVTGRFLVTGKFWPKMFEIEVSEK